MKAVIVGLSIASALVAGAAVAQDAPNEAGVTMGHWHMASNDLELSKKIFVAMGGTLVIPATMPADGVGPVPAQFPGHRVNLHMTNPGKGGTVGSVVNHVGYTVKNVQEQTAQWKAAGVPVLPGNNNRADQAFVLTPDGVRIEILEDKTQAVPIRIEHIHFFLTAAEIPKAQAWYAKIFGGKPGARNEISTVDIPGVQLRFSRAGAPQARTAGRVLDHIGFDVTDIQAFAKKLEAEGVTLDEPIRGTLTFITDPWGTRIELIQRARPR